MLVQRFRFSVTLFALCCCLSAPLYGEEEGGEEEREVVPGAESDGSESSGGAESSASKEPDSPKRVHLLPESIEQAALADESVRKQVVWLDSPEGKGGSASSFLALELYENTPEPQGAVIFLHGADQHPDWPQVIKPLRTLLTDDGWYTLSIMLPYENDRPVPEREIPVKLAEAVPGNEAAPRYSGRYFKIADASNAESSEEGGKEGDDGAEDTGGQTEEEPDNTAVTAAENEASEATGEEAGSETGEDLIDISADEKAVKPSGITFEEKVQMRLRAALEHAAQKNYQNIVIIGYKQGAQGLLDYLAGNRGLLPEQGMSMVWIDAQLRDGPQAGFTAALGEDFSLKMLDLVDSSSRTSAENGRQRLGQAKRYNYSGYSQVRLPIMEVKSLPVSTLTQRVRGWLKVNAPGMRAP